jgi:myo-inositol-1(or 4)-monophosphatase
MAEHDIAHFLAFADALADAAAEAVLPYFRAGPTITNKGGARFDPVTEADQAAERVMREMIERAFPEHGVLGEEFEHKESRSGYTWVLDPIDGTRAFIAGLPLWGVLIALNYEGRPIVGVMDQPYLQERYRGWNEAADATRKGERRPLKTRPCSGLGDAILSTTDPYLFDGAEAEAFARVRRAAKLTRYGCDCYAYSMVAAGTIDCVIESGLNAYDIAALIPIITGAGGGVSSWTSGDCSAGGRVLAYGDGRVRDEALELLASPLY